MNSEICLSCEAIERYLGEEEERVHALRGISLDLEPGIIHAVVGPSGCGKSTLLYILGLLDPPDVGRISIESQPVSHLSDDELAHKRNKFIGFIFQFHFLMEDFTAQENVMIPMRRLGQLSDAEMRERAAGLLEAVGLGDKLAQTQPSSFRGRTTACGHRARAGERSASDPSGRADRQSRYRQFRARLRAVAKYRATRRESFASGNP